MALLKTYYITGNKSNVIFKLFIGFHFLESYRSFFPLSSEKTVGQNWDFFFFFKKISFGCMAVSEFSQRQNQPNKNPIVIFFFKDCLDACVRERSVPSVMSDCLQPYGL